MDDDKEDAVVAAADEAGAPPSAEVGDATGSVVGTVGDAATKVALLGQVVESPPLLLLLLLVLPSTTGAAVGGAGWQHVALASACRVVQ